MNKHRTKKKIGGMNTEINIQQRLRNNNKVVPYDLLVLIQGYTNDIESKILSKDKTNVESNAHYSAYLEYGTSKMEPRPFMFPAFEKSRQPIEQAVFKRVVKKIEEMTK